MTTPSTARKAGPFTGTGSQTAWPFTFKVFAAGDVQVTIANSQGVETLLVLDTDYTVALNANQDTSPGGTVTYPISGSALPSGSVLAIVGDLDYDQPLDLPSGGNFSPTALENQLDRTTMQIQQLREEMDRTAKLPPTSTESVEELVDDLQRIADSADNLDTVANNIADIITVADDLNEPVSEINTVAGAIANVNTVGSNITNVNTVAGISANVTTVAGIAANVTTVAGIAANVTAVAGITAAVSAVAAIDDDVSTVAANVVDVTNFADVYLGPKTSDPTLRNNGSALQVGDLYFNTVDQALRTYGGTRWVAGTAGTMSVQNFSGNGSATAFTLNVAPASENNTQVYIGGVYQQKDQYSVSGTTLTFASAPPAGTDNIEVVTISTLALGETDAALVSYSPAGAVPTDVQTRLRDYEGGGGASLIGFGEVTVQDGLTALESAMPAKSGLLSNNPNATAKNITLIGDSISHGAFALNTFMHGWARILNRMVNAEVSANSYGFTNLLSLGSGGTQTLEIHSVSFGGPSWGAPAADSAQAQASPAGAPMRAGGVGSTITITLPFFQNRGEIHYIKQPGGGTFTITVNGVLAHTVDTNGAAIEWASQGFNMADAGYGSATIVVQQTVLGTVDIVGPGYLSSTIEPVFNNFATSGRRLRNTGQAVIQSLMSQSSAFIMALGHNDQGDADANDTYFGEFVQRIDWLIQYANQYNVKMVVPDFCWTASSTSRTRDQLRKLALETGGVYVDLPSTIFSGGQTPSTSYLIDTLKMWVDGSHPNKYGMKWIAETVSKAMGLSCTSKTDAILFHDFWMPLPLKSATSVENALPASASTVSAYKRNGDNVLVKLFVEAAPGGAFPTGTHSLTDSFNSKSELNLAQSGNGIGYVRSDTGAIVSTFGISSNGGLTLTVYSSFINDQAFTFSWPASTVRQI